LGNTGSGGARTASGTVSLHVLSPTEQLTELRGMVGALSGPAIISQGQATSLLKKLDNAQSAVTQGKPKLAYTNVQAFSSQLQSWVATGVLTQAQAGPLLGTAELLLQSLRTGGGF
jgi:hypothetical protein